MPPPSLVIRFYFVFGGGGEGMILRGLVLLCPFFPLSLLILLYSLVLTVEGRVVSYGVWNGCAPSLCLSFFGS